MFLFGLRVKTRKIMLEETLMREIYDFSLQYSCRVNRECRFLRFKTISRPWSIPMWMSSPHRHDNQRKNKFSKGKISFSSQSTFSLSSLWWNLTQLPSFSRHSKRVSSTTSKICFCLQSILNKENEKNCVIKFLMLLVLMSLRKGKRQEIQKIVDDCT